MITATSAPNTAPARASGGYTIDAVDRALRLIEELSRNPHLRVIDVAQMLSVSMSAAHRLLATLEARGFASHAATGRGYVPGPQLLELADRSMAAIDLKERARLALTLLSEDIEETLHFAVLQGSGVRFVEAVEGRIAPAAKTRRGLLLPAHATAAGKALLAMLPDDAVRNLYPRGFFPLTERGLRTVDELLADLKDVRRTGFALNRQESEDGVTGIAVCTPASHGRTVGAIVVTAPCERLCSARLDGIATRLRRVASAMSTAIR